MVYVSGLIGLHRCVMTILLRVQGQSGWTRLDPAWGANWQTGSAGQAPLDVRLTPNDGGPPLIAS